MKKSIFILFINITFLSIFSFNAFADFIQLTWYQAKDSQIKGWKIYYAVCEESGVCDPPVSTTNYDECIELEAFDVSNPQIPRPQFDLKKGLKISHDSQFPKYWLSTYRWYLPSSEDPQSYSLGLTAYDFDENESTMSETINVDIDSLEAGEEPVSDDEQP